MLFSVDAVCACPVHHKLAKDGKSCEFVPPCDRGDNGGCSDTCVNGEEKEDYSCSCPENYKLKDSRTCEIVHLCDR